MIGCLAIYSYGPISNIEKGKIISNHTCDFIKYFEGDFFKNLLWPRITKGAFIRSFSGPWIIGSSEDEILFIVISKSIVVDIVNEI